MGLRMARQGMSGPDVEAIQVGLNDVNQGGWEILDPDGKFGTKTDAAVRAFQTAYELDVDGIVGPHTRRALFPLVAVTINVLGLRLRNPLVPSLSPLQQRIFNAISPGVLTLGQSAPDPRPAPTPVVPLLGISDQQMVSYPGLVDTVPTPRTVASMSPGRLQVDWQQLAQTQRQFTGLFRNPQDSFAIGVQSVFKRNDDDGHVELATGCLLQRPIPIDGPGGNPATLACFANFTWVDPLGKLGRFHLWSPYGQEQIQGNLSGPANLTNQLSLFPVNMNVDLDDDGLQLNVNGGAAWNLLWTPTGFVSSWGPAIGIGLVGKFRAF
jgi:peptidoglycan hydrolase-like protein with peptidoglycan-binding domain